MASTLAAHAASDCGFLISLARQLKAAPAAFETAFALVDGHLPSPGTRATSWFTHPSASSSSLSAVPGHRAFANAWVNLVVALARHVGSTVVPSFFALA